MTPSCWKINGAIEVQSQNISSDKVTERSTVRNSYATLFIRGKFPKAKFIVLRRTAALAMICSTRNAQGKNHRTENDLLLSVPLKWEIYLSFTEDISLQWKDYPICRSTEIYFLIWDTDSLYPKLKIVTFHINTFHFSVTSFVQTLKETSN